MNPKVRRFLLYVLMPVVFVAIGYALILFGGKGAIDLMKDEINMAMTKGAPDYPNGFDENLYKKVVENGNVKEWSEVPLPAMNTSYAVISSQELGIEADVYYGDADDCFANGIGQYTGSHLFGCGSTILLGGHDSTYFAGLEQAKSGDRFQVLTNYGMFEYEVTDTAIVKATDRTAYDLNQTEEQLILYTCYPFGKITSAREDRFFVYCKRIDDGAVIKEAK